MMLTAMAAMAAQPLPPEMADLIAEARDKAVVGDTVWPGFSDAPFGLLLVTEDGETLLCEDRIPSGFTTEAEEPVTGCSRAVGPSSWRQPGMLAAMPLFGPPETIVIGTPAATGLNAANWQRIVLHEHFHQWQGMLPDYYQRVTELDLSGGDETGMWMINYAFPYHDPSVIAAFEKARFALHAALFADDASLQQKAASYVAARAEFAAAAGEQNWRYFDFQLWKEGVARWTDVTIGLGMGDGWAEAARESWANEQAALATLDLAEVQRAVVYPYGAAEAALLDRLSENWRDCYARELTMTPCWENVL